VGLVGQVPGLLGDHEDLAVAQFLEAGHFGLGLDDSGFGIQIGQVLPEFSWYLYHFHARLQGFYGYFLYHVGVRVG